MRRMLLWMLVVALLLAAMPAGAAAAKEPEHTATLYADFSCGGEDDGGLISQFELGYDGELTVKILANGLSALTGLDFKIGSAKPAADGLRIDWSKNSTLVGGLDEREQKEDFFFYDVDSLSWFMMDSLWRTVRENLGVENVYYTMNGGKALRLKNMVGVPTFQPDEPYMGSAAYLAGGEEGGPFQLWLGETEQIEGLGLPEQSEHEFGACREAMTDDGLVVVSNWRLDAPDPDAYESLEKMVEANALATSGDDAPYKPRVFQDEDAGARLSYPSYLVSWNTGANEDLREHVALAVLTDDAMLLYAVAVSADWFEEYQEGIYRVLDGLQLQEE